MGTTLDQESLDRRIAALSPRYRKQMGEMWRAPERVFVEQLEKFEAWEAESRVCEKRDASRRVASVRTPAETPLVSDGDDPRVCENDDFSQRLNTPEESSRELHQKPVTVRTRGDYASPDEVLEQRIWLSSMVGNPFSTRAHNIELFAALFGKSRATYDRHARVIRAGWRPPFRSAP